ncbi:MAG: hypothetical protein U0271_16900 [Polyangiaceae bacterium]
MKRPFVAAALAVSLALLAQSAFADDNQLAAESLFATGKKQMEAKQYGDACKSFAESQRLGPSVGTLLNLGLCNELQGKLATAWATYKEAGVLAQQRNDNRVATADENADRLEPKLSKLAVTVKETVPDMVIKRDGTVIAAIGVPIAIDPGEHEITASAPGYITYTVRVTMGKEKDSKTLEIPALEKDPNAPKPDTNPKPDKDTDKDKDKDKDSDKDKDKDKGQPASGGLSGVTIGGFVVGGVGIVGLAIGGAMGGLAMTTASNAEGDPSLCPDKQCTAAGREEIDSAETQALVSTVGFAVGGAALAAGVVMIAVGFTMGSSDEHASVRPFFFTTPSRQDSSVAGLGGFVTGLEGSF